MATQRKPAGLAPLPAAEWESVRLTFKRSMIEQLKPSQSFRVSTREGVFQMTRAKFEKDFPNVVASRSYQRYGIYSYLSAPRKALRYLAR